MSASAVTLESGRIERDENVQFHVRGTLSAVTRWVTSDDEGIAEWLKNARRMYQVDRANVAESDRVAAILLRDAHGQEPARIGVLDVGGASAADLERWSVWQDPDASRPTGKTDEEQTQGNGGKAYMYRLFMGPARLLGVASNLRNCRGFVGAEGSEERGTAGWMPSRAEGRDAPAAPGKDELNEALEPYGISFDSLPASLRRALDARQAFTLVEGEAPKGAFHGRIDADTIIERVVRHEQSTLALEQMRVYAIHNGQLLCDGKPLQLEQIEPYIGFEKPRIIAIPETLPYPGRQLSTTADGAKDPGRLVLRTSRKNMATAHKRLKPRWKISYRTKTQMIGAKPVAELAPATPGSYFVYGTVELPALEPDYVSHGRVRPNDGPLMEALDEFVAEQIKVLSREIADRHRHEFDERELDEVARENSMLDRWKDQFLPTGAEGGDTGPGTGGGNHNGTPGESKAGIEPYVIEVRTSDHGYVLGAGVEINLQQILSPVVRDEFGNPVSGVKLGYRSDNESVLRIERWTGRAVGVSKGQCSVYVQIDSTGLSSELIPLEVVMVDHVLLTPRQIELPVGTRKEIVAEVTTDEGRRLTEVLLNWRHDAGDPLVIRIRPTGVITGNRVGTTQVYAGAGDPESGVWSRVPAVVSVVENLHRDGKGEGHPQLKITGRDIDPETGNVREGDPEQPALWQDPVDVANNIWWLNLEAPEAALAFRHREDNPQIWRMLHTAKLVEMVCQVHMQVEYDAPRQAERLEPWAMHKQALERYQVDVGPAMWEELSSYVISGGEVRL